MFRHAESEFRNGLAPAAEQARAERGIDPGPCHDSSAVLRDPLFLGQMRQFLDRLGSLQTALVE